jgi:hypothetical protein
VRRCAPCMDAQVSRARLKPLWIHGLSVICILSILNLKKSVDRSILIAGYSASLRAVYGCARATLALHHHKCTLHIVQLINDPMDKVLSNLSDKKAKYFS